MIVNYLKSNVLLGTGKTGEFLFVPGNNEISNSLWADLMSNANFKRRVDSGYFKITSQAEPSGEGEIALADFGPAEAKQVVRDTFDPELLRTWQKAETRKTVLSVIEEQLEKADKRVAEAKKKKEGDDDSEDEE